MHDAQEVRKHTKTFKENDAIIKRGLATYLEVGRALMELRDKEQYKEAGYDTLEECCQKRYGMSRRSVYYFIEAAEYVDGLPVQERAQILNKNQALNAAKAERDKQAFQSHIDDLADQARAAGFKMPERKPAPTFDDVERYGTFADEQKAFPDLAARFIELLPAEVLKKAFLDAAKVLHPDHGGDPEQMSELNHIWKRMQLVLKGFEL